MDSNYEKSLLDSIKQRNLNDYENDKYKNKILISNSFEKTTTLEFNPNSMYSYLVCDVYSRYLRMKGYNILFETGVNNISNSSFNLIKNALLDFDLVKNRYKDNLDELNVSYDSKYFFASSNLDIIKEMDLFFYLNFSKCIFYDTCDVFETSVKDKIYNFFEVEEINNRYYSINSGEEVFKNNAKVLYLDFAPFEEEIRQEINNLDIKDSVKKYFIEKIGEYENLKLSFDVDTKFLDVELKDPELIAGISFITLNPKYMDVLNFVSQEEKDLIYKYMQNGYDLAKFSGLFAKNPLNYSDICIFISYEYDEAIHLGIPDISERDLSFCQNLGITPLHVLDNNKLINSDFLTGLNRIDARNLIISSFVSEGIALCIKHFKNTRIIISSMDCTGVPIPLEVKDNGTNISLVDSSSFPIYYNKFLKVIYNTNLNRPVELINLNFNSTYQNSILDLYLSKEELYYNQKEFLNNSYKFVRNTELFESILSPIIFSICANRKVYKKKYFILNKQILDKNYIKESNNLNLMFITDCLKHSKRDAIRVYILTKEADTLENIMYHLDHINYLLDDILKKYEEREYDTINYILDKELYNFVMQEEESLRNLDFVKYYNNLELFFNNKIKNKKWTEEEALIFLKILSIICPFLSQYIYEIVLNERDYIMFEPWPRY